MIEYPESVGFTGQIKCPPPRDERGRWIIDLRERVDALPTDTDRTYFGRDRLLHYRGEPALK